MRFALTVAVWETIRPWLKRVGASLLAHYWAAETRRELNADRKRRGNQ